MQAATTNMGVVTITAIMANITSKAITNLINFAGESALEASSIKLQNLYAFLLC